MSKATTASRGTPSPPRAVLAGAGSARPRRHGDPVQHRPGGSHLNLTLGEQSGRGEHVLDVAPDHGIEQHTAGPTSVVQHSRDQVGPLGLVGVPDRLSGQDDCAR